jgi:UDP-N-acetylglucosamine 2-epimerase (non-hydrolysing)
MARKKLCIVFGTRPEAIKLAPLMLAARELGDVETIACNTGQHRELTAQVLGLFSIVPQVDLDIMQHQQSLADVTMAILARLQPVLELHRPDWVVVQGDTTTTFAAALAAFYQKIPIAHVEAGLRTGNIYSPWPEEMNRRLVSNLATLHFPPTSAAAENLMREGVDRAQVMVTGNTGIDALKILVARMAADKSLHGKAIAALTALGVPTGTRPLVLITGHRRESFGEGLESICRAIAELAIHYPDHDFVYPVHPNPKVRDTVQERLGNGRRDNVYLVPPLEYLPFIELMARSQLILTDSGGVQEEGPSLGKRVIVLRELTERGEGLETGLIRLAGTNTERIIAAAVDALSGKWAAPSDGRDVYGDGEASARILDRIRAWGSTPARIIGTAGSVHATVRT